MITTTTQMYWLVMLDKIEGIAYEAFIASALLSLLCFVIYAIIVSDFDIKVHPLRRCGIGFAIAAPILAIVFALTPSTKQMAAILVVPKIVNSEAIQKDVPELFDLAIEWSKDRLKGGDQQ